jgi:N-sulfoglucosamine sulfohydrolase
VIQLTLAVAAASSATASCVAAERNIVVIITDDQSLTLGCYGDPVAHSPRLDELAADGLLFHHAYATTASCSASRSVVLSGLHNHKNGQYGHTHHFHKFASYPDLVSLTLPTVLRQVGYRTARIGKYHVAPEAAYRFETILPGPTRNPVQMAENCREFLADADDPRPFLLYFATADPHRGGGVDARSPLELKPDLFGNPPDGGAHAGVDEASFSPDDVRVPPFLSDTAETRAELAQYYQSCARVDAGVGRLVEILRELGLYDKTLIVFTSDHGMAFAGAKTTVYEPGLRVPLVVRNPYVVRRGAQTDALVSHVDLTPTLLDFAEGLDREANAPRDWQPPEHYLPPVVAAAEENRNGGQQFRRYQGRSWLMLCEQPEAPHRETIFASHTFHEIQMYYPMRVLRDAHYKLIWNIAHPLPYPFASDLWVAASWRAQYRQGLEAPYGSKTVGVYLHRPEFELYAIDVDPHETRNLANDLAYAAVLKEYQKKLRDAQRRLEDPWILKWEYQ